LDRVKTFLATGLAPDGRLYAGDLNAIEDAAAALSDFAQTLDLGTLRVGQSDLQLLRYGGGAGSIASEARLTGDLRTDGILRPLGGMILGTFTTTQRDAIAAGGAPYGTLILNSTLNVIQMNTGTDGARVWQSVGGSSVYTASLGDGSTTDFTITHSLNSRDVLVVVRENAAPYTKVYPEVEFTNTTQIHLIFPTAPTAGQYVVTIVGGSGGVQTPSAHASTHHANGTDALAWSTINGRGTLAARPAAAATNSSYRYFATDVDGGTEYQSDGSAWNQTGVSILAVLGKYRKKTSKTVNTSVAATDLLNGEITIAAGLMGIDRLLRLTAWGDFLQNAAAAPPRFQVIFGGTTIFDTGTNGTVAANATRSGWRLVTEILNLGAANSQFSTIAGVLGILGGTTGTAYTAFTTGEGNYAGVPIGASATNISKVLIDGVNPATAVDTSAAKLLELKVINGSASATYETKLLGALVEIV
jgi:hypothetical protein